MSDNKIDLAFIKSLFAEFLSTVFFAFVVFGSIISAALTNNSVVQLISVGVAVGFSGVAIIYSFMDHALAHFNPAITLAAVVCRKIPVVKGLFYILSQILGALGALGIIYLVYPNKGGPGEKLGDYVVSKRADGANIFRAISMEFMLTFILVFVAFSTAIGANHKPASVRLELPESTADLEQANVSTKVKVTSHSSTAAFAPIAIGFTLGFLVFLGGASSGGTFNPALALAPSIVTGSWSQIYIYLVGEILGGVSAGALHTLVFENKKTA